MLNCTDIECMLHHHHYYHHDNKLQHHLQDNRAHHEHHHVVMSGDATDRNIEQDILNNATESELNLAHVGLDTTQTVTENQTQDLSIAEEPNESVYMVCGVLIAMMLVGLIIVLLAVTISKLRKREDNLPTTTATPTTNTTSTTTNHNNNVIQQTNNHNHLHSTNQTIGVPTQQPEVTTTVSQTTETLPPPFLWVYHSNGNSTTASSQYTLYNTDQDTLVHNLPCEEPRECKGFRKNLRGKWRRLVKKKPPQEVYTIPAELRDQLKQIYVY